MKRVYLAVLALCTLCPTVLAQQGNVHLRIPAPAAPGALPDSNRPSDRPRLAGSFLLGEFPPPSASPAPDPVIGGAFVIYTGSPAQVPSREEFKIIKGAIYYAMPGVGRILYLPMVGGGTGCFAF